MIASIKRKLSKLNPVILEVIDDSHKHSGHHGIAGIDNDVSHVRIKVVSNHFDGMSKIDMHKLIYKILEDEINSGLHSISITAHCLR